MATGKIKNLREGYGFITVKGENDVFFHMSGCTEDSPFNDLTVGDEVEFEMGESRKGPRAENVRKV